MTTAARPRPSWLPEVESWPWQEVRRFVRRLWQPGEHASVFAPTKTGKTYLWTRLLAPMWDHTLTIDGKFGDPQNIEHARALGAHRVRSMPSPDFSRFWGGDPWPKKHYWLEPEEERIFGTVNTHLRDTFAAPRRHIRVIAFDEWKVNARKPDGYDLYPIASKLLRQGQGRKITVVGMTQDPFWMGPSGRDLKGQCRWYYFGRTRDQDSLDSYRGISGLDRGLTNELLPELGRHEWLLWAPDHETLTRFTLPGPKVMRGTAKR